MKNAKFYLILCVSFAMSLAEILTNKSELNSRSTNSDIEIERVDIVEGDGEHVTRLYSNSLNDMLEMVNDSMNPCEDFFQHACGNYETYQQNSMTAPPFLSNQEDRMHFFIEHKDEFVTEAGKHLRQLYDECKQRGRRNARAQWRRMLREIDFFMPDEFLYRHFPLLQFQWDNWVRAGGSNRRNDTNGKRQVSWVPLAAQLAAHGMPTVLHIFFAEQTIYIAPPTGVAGGWRCPSWWDITASLQPMLRGRNAQIPLMIGRELWQLCMQLSDDGWSMESESDADKGNDNGGKEFLLHEDIVAYFDTFFGVMNFSIAEVDNARKLLLNVDQLQHILHVVQKTEPRILFNYVLWRAYEQLRYDDCYQLTAEFQLALQAEYWHWHVFQRHLSRDVTLALYLFHTARYHKQRQQQLSGARSWESVLLRRGSETEKQRRRLLTRIRELDTLIRQYANRLSVVVLAPFSDAVLKSHSFYGNLVQLRRQQLRQSFYTPYIDTDDDDDKSEEPSHVLSNFLNFAISLTKRPLFHYFATSDFELWHTSPLFHQNDDFYAAWHCLALNIEQPLSESEALAIYRFGNAFRAAYEDYQFWLEAQTFAFAEDFFLDYFGIDRERVLFYAVTQTFCGRNNALYAPRVNRSFQQLHEFQNAFNCTNDEISTVNPATKCLSIQ